MLCAVCSLHVYIDCPDMCHKVVPQLTHCRGIGAFGGDLQVEVLAPAIVAALLQGRPADDNVVQELTERLDWDASHYQCLF
eukprot:SAG31_NODE_2871_length_4973_cov_4.568322_4_plen_81_part_00